MIRNTIKIKVEGINIYEFIKYVKKNKISLEHINIINIHLAYFTLSNENYLKITSLKTSYKMTIISYTGTRLFKQVIKKRKYLILGLIIGFILINILSRLIFKIEVHHNKATLRNFIIEQMAKYDLNKYHFKKSYKDILTIKNKILDDNKDTLEWLEIIPKGNKYIVRLEERVIIKNEENNINQNIISSKNALITKISSSSGVIVKKQNDYVRKGEIIISGAIKHNDDVKGYTKALGEVYGEVWYKASVSHPLTYYEEIYGEKIIKNAEISLGSKRLFLIPNDHYKQISKTIFKLNHPILPLSFSINEYQKVRIIDNIYTVDEALQEAILKAETKIMSNLDVNEKIVSKKVLKYEINSDKINVEIFFRTLEQIGVAEEIVIGDEINVTNNYN